MSAEPKQNAGKPVAFLFAGQGAQYTGMASELADAWPWFRAEMDRLFAVVQRRPEAEWTDVWLGRNETGKLLEQTAFTQPILFAMEVALTRVWERWGVKPGAVLGHSLGEFAAAWSAGVFTAEDGMRLVTERGHLMQTLPRNGKYVVVKGDLAEVAETVRPWKRTIAVAGVNAPQLIVVSGLREDMDRVLVDFRRRNMMVRELPVSLPFHSPLMDPILEKFEKLSQRFEFRKVTIPWASNLTGQFLGDKEVAGPEYWRKHIREPVRFWSGMECLANAGYEVFLEIGPGRTLVTMGKEAIGEAAGTWINSLEKGTNSREVLWKAAQRLAQDEVQVDLELARNDCFSRE